LQIRQEDNASNMQQTDVRQACEHPPSQELESQLPVSQQQPPQIKVSGVCFQNILRVSITFVLMLYKDLL
jgi:hypothetical protein